MLTIIPLSDLFGQAQKPTRVTKPAYFDITEPLRDIAPVEPGIRDRSWKDDVVGNKLNADEYLGRKNDYTGPDPLLQKSSSGNKVSEPVILQNFDGGENLSGIAPPDTDGDVGPDHYFQMINLQFNIFDKEGNLLYGPADNSTLWDGFIGPWTGTNDGDPIVLYDEHADRWLASQFALPDDNGPWYELIAISATGDPLGEWYRYAYEFDRMPDYPKFGIWPDGYYFTINQFEPFDGAGVCVVNRDAMLDGDPDAELIFWDLINIYFGLLPSDADGELMPPVGSPGIMLSFDYGNLLRWEATVDWENTGNSELEKMDEIPLASFSTSNLSIKQPGTAWTLDALSDRLMYRLQYRNFGDYEVMLTNHTVNRGFNKAGIRWYELRSVEGGPWEIYQHGTYGPDGDENRWLASIAMNQNGDIALGYSVSGVNTYPSIRIAGQSAGAPGGPGVLDIPETVIYDGQNSQIGVARWGDYCMMSIDPVDDNTFWFTTEYTSGFWSWKTRIASFSFTGFPSANFTANETILPVGGSTDFSDLSGGNPDSWQWTFSGGDPGTSTVQNPENITYDTEGTFDVQLIVTNEEGSDTLIKEDFITVTNILPDVNFFTFNDLVCLGDEMKFIDLTQYAPIHWLWEFDPATVTFVNGTDETSQHPEVTFDEGSYYDVTLTAWNLNGQSSEIKEDYIAAGGLLPPFEETFENGIGNSNWTIDNPNYSTWQLYETGGTSPGTTSAGIVLTNNFSLGERDRLISPPLNLTGFNNAVLEFTHAYVRIQQQLTDSLIVYISSDCSDNWERIYADGEDGSGNFATHEPIADFLPATSDDWCLSGWGADCNIIDVSDYSGESGVRIAFESYAATGHMMFIDNVTINGTTGQDENLSKTEEFSIFPNPTNGTFTVIIPQDQGYNDMKILNNLGQIVYTLQLDESKRAIQVNPDDDWETGIYILKATGAGKTSTKKVILL